MDIQRIAGATRVLGAPKGWDHEAQGECVGLPIVDHPDGWMISEWKPNQDEMRALIEGGSIRLWVQGSAHPVVSLEAISSDGTQHISGDKQMAENNRWLRQTLESLTDTMRKQVEVCQLALDATK